MKMSWGVLLASVLAAAAALLAPVEASCKSQCMADLVHHRERACQKWRKKLPRPDLFNHCGQGFNKGKVAGCDGYCDPDANMSSMKAKRLDACASLKGVPPQDRQMACQAGFSDALDLARTAAVHDDSSQGSYTDTAGSTGTAGGTAGRKLEATAGVQEPVKKQKVTVKKVTEARTLLEQAREEAANAYTDPLDVRATKEL